MTKTDLINAIKAIDPNAKTWGLDKDELQALLTELQAKATNPEQGQAAGAESTPADPAADTSSAVVNENPALVNNSGENVNENPDLVNENPDLVNKNPETVNNSGDVVNNGAEVVNPEQGQAAAEGAPADPAANVPREKKPEDLIKNDVAPAELTPAFYVVAEGRAITSKRGILAAGEAVEARDFVGGEETINSLLERGLVE